MMVPKNERKKNQVRKMRILVYYSSQICFTVFPILMSILLLFDMTREDFTKGLDMTLLQNQITVLGLVLCFIVPVSILVGWLFLKMWVIIAKQSMTPSEIRRFIERGIGIKV